MSMWRASTVLSVKRLARSFGYRGRRPAGAVALVVLAVVLVDVVAATLLAEWLGRVPVDEALLAALVPTTVVLLLYALAGPLVLLAESARTRGSALERALQSVPLSRSAVRVLVWAPSVAISLLAVGLLGPPAVAALLASGLPLAGAALLTTAVCAVATATAAVLLAATKLVLRGARWTVAHYPVALLAFELALVVLVVSATDLDLRPSVLDRALVAPLLLAEVQRHGVVAAGTLTLASVGGAVLTVAALLACATLQGSEHASDVLVPWRPRRRPRLGAGEVVRLLRVPHLTANLAGAVVIGVGIVLVVLRSAPGAGVVEAAVVAVGLLAGVPARLVRASSRIVNPQAQLAGVDRTAWARATGFGAAALFLIGVAPLSLLLVRPDLWKDVELVSLGAVLVTCLACAVALSWSMPGSVEVDAGQVVAALVYVLAAGVTTWGVTRLAEVSGPLALALPLCALAGSFALASVVEPARWQPHGRSAASVPPREGARP